MHGETRIRTQSAVASLGGRDTRKTALGRTVYFVKSRAFSGAYLSKRMPRNGILRQLWGNWKHKPSQGVGFRMSKYAQYASSWYAFGETPISVYAARRVAVAPS